MAKTPAGSPSGCFAATIQGHDVWPNLSANCAAAQVFVLSGCAFVLSAQAQTVTFLCRSLAAESGDCFVIAALGVRADSPAQDRRAADASAEARVSDATAALRRSLAARHGARSPRFLWKTDAAGRFTDVTHTLADVVGEKAADILGRSVQDATHALTLDAAFARAVASRRAWSGVEVEWPLEGDAGCVPTTLGALQMTDSAGRFLGYQGYGVLHIDRGRVAEPAAATAFRLEY